MSKIWFSADSHFGHRNIINYCHRPYRNIEEMDRDLIENWNMVVEESDEVYYLGDFALDFKRVRQVAPLLKGKIHLVAGNHDLCHSSNQGSGSYHRHYMAAGFVDICESTSLEIAGEEVLLCHLPYFDPLDPDQRLPEYKPDDRGNWLLHGHVHARWKTSSRQINVGVDVWDFFPVSLEAIADLIKSAQAENEMGVED